MIPRPRGRGTPGGQADTVSDDGEKYTFNYPIKSIKNSARGDKFAVVALLYF